MKMNIKNKIILGLVITSIGLIQTSNAYNYGILNNTGESITVEIVTSSAFAPKPQATIGDGEGETLKIGGIHKGAGLSKINIKGEQSGDLDSISLKRMGLGPLGALGNKEFVIKGKAKGYSIRQIKR